MADTEAAAACQALAKHLVGTEITQLCSLP